MAAKTSKVPSKQFPKQMSDSWIVIDDEDESDFVVIDREHDDIQSPKPSPQIKRPLCQNNHENTKGSASINANPQSNNNNRLPHPSKTNSGGSQNKKRKWKVLYSLPSSTTTGKVNEANLDPYVMDQHAQLFEKRDLFTSDQPVVKVK